MFTQCRYLRGSGSFSLSQRVLNGSALPIFSADFTFSSPLDVGLNRKAYFDRCRPGAGNDQEFSFARMIESGDELMVTYEFANGSTGRRGRNSEIFSFAGGQIRAVEVYFGWNVR